jgi:carboxymethylenebutenolidase
MIEEHIDIQTKDGAMNTFITRPDRDGPFPVIIFLMDAPGKREELHDMARRIATVGYYVMLPNLYYRQVREFVVGPDTREIMFGYMNALGNGMVCEDVGVLLEHAAQEADASDGPVGTLGYCMSGPFSFSAAAAYPDRIKAAGLFVRGTLMRRRAKFTALASGSSAGRVVLCLCRNRRLGATGND